MDSQKIKGLVAAPFTPMNQDRSINLKLIPKLYKRFRQLGITGVFINGSTSEGLSLTTAERKDLAEAWSDTVDDEFKLLIHVGHAGIDDAKGLASHAAQCTSVAGISMVGPFYRKPGTVSELVSFCREVVREAPDLPFYYYHIPALSGVDFTMYDFLAEASTRIPTLRGIKFTNSDLIDFSRCLEYNDGEYDIMFGNDELMSCGLMLGARGFVGSTYNLFPHLYHEIINAFDHGELSRVRILQRKSMEFVRLIDQYGYGGAAKGVMKLLALDCGPARLPLRTIKSDELKSLEEDLKQADFFKYTIHKQAVS
ncbi:dihydrodipicolinate synthase family protein [Fodinibius sediminis]|uniref:N-acetylneuraminate lyase n=1 Tax=Fodinibius sediminis TaxID=1214077 RepID=A0A521EQF5_9BACT|nr:dihydrodipicolinate synthase family protein [Fodinibius sediminis]SMO86157.1 N-acetylneuraminate lyase [Fodinibius sediminis]